MLNKKGMELSISFIVALIIAITVFSMGIYFATRLFSEADIMKGELDRETQAKIEALLDDGSAVVVPLNTFSLKKGQSHVFGLGISNIFERELNFRFTITPGPCSGICEETPDPPLQFLPAEAKTFEIGPNERPEPQRIAVGVPSNAQRGTYVLNVKVEYEDPVGTWNDYDTIKKLYIKVI